MKICSTVAPNSDSLLAWQDLRIGMWTGCGCYRRRCTFLFRPGTLAHLVRDPVREALDLSAIRPTYDERPVSAYHPAMMVALLLYAYSRGLSSSRRSRGPARSGWTSGGHGMTGRISARSRVPEAASDGAWRAVRAGAQAVPRGGAGHAGHVALDGTKIKANASRAQGDELRADVARPRHVRDRGDGLV